MIVPPKTFGLMGAVFGIGFIFGPAIGGQLANPAIVSWFNAATPFWFAAILSIVNMGLLFLFLPETRVHVSTKPIDLGKSLHHIGAALRMEKLRSLFVVGFLYNAGFSFFVTFFGVYLIARYGFTAANIGNFFAYVGVWISIVQGGLTPMVARRWREQRVLTFTLIGTGLALLLYLLPGPWLIMLAIVPVFAISNGLSQANYMGLLSRSASAEVQGEVLGINASVSALAQAIPPILSGIIAAESAPGVTIVVASVFVVAAGVMFVLTPVRGTSSTPLPRER